MDLTSHRLWNYSVRYVLVLMELRSRRVVHVAVWSTSLITTKDGLIRESRANRDAAPACRGRFVLRQGTAPSRSWHARCSMAFTTTTDLPCSSGSPMEPAAGAQAGLVDPGHSPSAGF